MKTDDSPVNNKETLGGRSSPSMTQETFEQNINNKTIGSKTYDEKDGFLNPIPVNTNYPVRERKQIKIEDEDENQDKLINIKSGTLSNSQINIGIDSRENSKLREKVQKR